MNKQTLQNILVFLNRVDLKGNEAIPLAQTQQSVSAALSEFPEDPKEEKKSDKK